MNKAITKYLQTYAEPEVHLIEKCTDFAEYEHVVVIPAYKENKAFYLRFNRSLLAQRSNLVILVINQPDTDNCQQPQRLLFDEVKSSGDLIWQEQHLYLLKPEGCQSSVLVVDRFSQPIPAKQGLAFLEKLAQISLCI